MANTKQKIKDLKNIKSFGYSQLSMWGMVGALVLFAYSIVSTIMVSAIDSSVADWIFRLIGLVLGVLYAVLGVFALIKVIKSQEGSYWGVFLTGAVLAIFSPLAWYGVGGIILAVLAGLAFLIYYILEKNKK